MRRLPAVLALVAVAAGCGSDPGLPDLSESIECRVPCETVTDWVSYADHVAYIEVTAERELPFEQLEGDPEGNGYVPREVTAETGDVATGPDTPARAALVGESPADVAAELAATAADPVAARYFDLDPIARYEAVVRETEG